MGHAKERANGVKKRRAPKRIFGAFDRARKVGSCVIISNALDLLGRS